MTTLSSLRSRIRQTLGDTSAARYSNDHIDEAVRRALADLSAVLPNLASGSLTLSAAGRAVDLSSFPNIRSVLSLRFPYNPAAAQETSCHTAYYFCHSSGSPTLHIQGAREPQPGDAIFIEYSADHTIAELDAAAQTTLPDSFAHILVTGAAAYAALFRSSHIAEAHGSRASDLNQLYQWGSQLMQTFRSMLAGLKSTPIAQRRPPGLWRLDTWDK